MSGPRSSAGPARPPGLAGPVLGIETSCDETSAAVVVDGRILGHVVLSQDAHRAFGGVVPEIAARAHLRQLDGVVRAALREADLPADRLAAVGATAGPGLVGALLTGLNWAKAYAYGLGRPCIGVHHMEAHLFANALHDPEARPPFVALLVSGGHTLLLYAPEWGRYELLGETRDDAAGEAFDKVARRLGFGFPGGPEIERQARQGVAGRFRLPRPMLAGKDGPADPAWFDFSFSGLKTATALLAAELERQGPGALEEARADLAAEFQAAVIETLAEKTRRAVAHTGCARVLIGGGVACNGALRDRLTAVLPAGGRLFAPPPRLAGDNAAMVAHVAAWRLARGESSPLELNADPSLPFPGLVRRTTRPGPDLRTEEAACIPN
ncbi:MAG: tRNA (adenosine(37)-N6)-threonylcarbamoyltransferase complex transferase subunit TsaD [Gemmatimonadota bacterium]|nr:tRNA (adenosine(37)-N6)-threonylcarbamoyltransferase complex transferase subunit TsaD [Gemmatimonadota bacterium]